jgi:hypothetical protein
MHGFLSQETWLSLGLIAVLVLVFGWGYLSVNSKYHAVETASENPHEKPHQKITGLSFNQYNDHGIVTRLEADTLTVVPRRRRFLNIKSINEAYLVNVRAETWVTTDKSQAARLLPASEEMLMSNGSNNNPNPAGELGLITKSTVDGLYLKIFKAGSLAVVLKAGHAETDMKSGKTRLTMASLENPGATKRITSKKVIWDVKDQEFRIPGAYIAHTDKGRASGRGIKVDLDFQISAL